PSLLIGVRAEVLPQVGQCVLGLYPAGRDGVDRDAVLSVLVTYRLERPYRRRSTRVVHGVLDVARRLFGGGRTDMHESAPACFLHRRKDRMQQEDLAHRVHFEGLTVDVQVGDVGEIPGPLVLRLADDDERRTVLGGHLPHRVAELLRVADVCADADRGAAITSDRLDRGFDVGLGSGQYCYPRTLAGKLSRDLEADSLAAADDQRRTPVA